MCSVKIQTPGSRKRRSRPALQPRGFMVKIGGEDRCLEAALFLAFAFLLLAALFAALLLAFLLVVLLILGERHGGSAENQGHAEHKRNKFLHLSSLLLEN